MQSRQKSRSFAALLALVAVVTTTSAAPAEASPVWHQADPAPTPRQGRTQDRAALADRVDGGEVTRAGFSETTANPDGSHSTVFSARPLHWQDGHGAWRDFESKVRGVEGRDGVAHEADLGPYTLSFATPDGVRSGGHAISLRAEGRSVTLTPLGALPTAIETDSRTLRYVDAFGGADLRYSLDRERLKEDIVLAGAPAGPLSFAFALSLEGLKASASPDDSISITNDQGEREFFVPPPMMTDAAGDTHRVEMAFTQDPSGGYLMVLEPDAAWLADPQRAYPVEVDPSFYYANYRTDTPAGESVMIHQGFPTTNYGGRAAVTIGKNGSGEERDVLIDFPDLDALPRDATVVHAEMTFDPDSGDEGLGVEIRRNTGAWAASTVTWDSAPGSVNYHSVTTTLGVNEVVLTTMLNGWVRDEYPQEGIRLSSNDGNGEIITVPTSGAGAPLLNVHYIKDSRLGRSGLHTYSQADHGGGTSSSVNLSSGNLVVQHQTGSIPARGFSLDLVHTYNSLDSFGQSKPAPDTMAVYGEAWNFSQDVRIQQTTEGAAAVLKLGDGQIQTYVLNTDIGGTRTYKHPLHYDAVLTKDTDDPVADANKVWTLVQRTGGQKWFFNGAGRLTRRQDRNGNYLTYTYDGSARLTRITDVAGRETVLQYLGSGSPARLSKITDVAGRVSTFGYDSYGNLTTVKHAVGTSDEVTTTFAYPLVSQIGSVTNPRGHRSEFDHAIAHGWETSLEGWAAGARSSVARSTAEAYTGTASMRVTLTDIGATDATGGLAYRTHAPAKTFGATPLELVAFVYAPAGAPALTATLRARQGCANGEQAISGSLVAGQWNALHIDSVEADPACPIDELALAFKTASGTWSGALYVDHVFFKGLTTAVSDARPAHTRIAKFAYDWATRTTTVERPDQAGVDRATTFRHTQVGQVDRVTSPLGHVTDISQDEFLRLSEMTLPGGTASTYTLAYYPDSNQLQSMTNEQGERTRRGASTTNGDTSYMIDPRHDKRRDDGQNYEATIYNRDLFTGNIESVATGQYSTADVDDSPMPQPDTLRRKTEFTYGTGGVVTGMKDPKGNWTYFDYQAGTGYLTEIDAPAGSGEGSRRITTITPNSDGTIAQVIDAEGQKRTYEYDDLGRLRVIDYGVVSGVPDFSVTYTLDKNGNMTAMSDDAGSSTWTYDQNNRPTSESRTRNAMTKSASYDYFANGLQSSMTTFAGQTSAFGYDAALRLVSQTDPKDAGRSIAFTLDDRDRIKNITYGSGVEELTFFDPAGRVSKNTLRKADGTLLSRFTYDYGIDEAGVRTTAYRSGAVLGVTDLDGSQETYAYDALGRLNGAERTGTDPFDQSYTYDANSNRTSITEGGSTTSATFDNANQLIGHGATSYTYDRNGNMTGFGSNTLSYDAADRWSGGTVAGSSLDFDYDGLGRRVRATDDGVHTNFWYDRTGLTLETGGTAATYLRDPGGSLLSSSSGGTLANFGRDRLGSVRRLVSTAGTVTRSLTYDPWGKTIDSTGAGVTSFRYTGVYFDAATSMYRMTHRSYQPATGRFTQLDPNPQEMLSANRFAYAGCNPTNFTDPSGLSHCPLWAHLASQAAIAALAIAGAVPIVLFISSLPASLVAFPALVTYELAIWQAIRFANAYNQQCWDQ